jgi:prevent-host-death family protein
MVRRLPFLLTYAPAVKEHLRAIDAKYHFSALLKTSEQGPIIVTRNGMPVAVLVGVQDEDEIERLVMAYSPRLRTIVEKSRRQIRAGHGIEHEKFWSDIEDPASTKRRKARE